jgi:hypothetical protein
MSALMLTIICTPVRLYMPAAAADLPVYCRLVRGFRVLRHLVEGAAGRESAAAPLFTKSLRPLTFSVATGFGFACHALELQ